MIVSDAPDPSGLFVPLTVGFSVTSSVGGPLDGTVTVQDVEGGWSCSAPVGAGSCDLRFGGLGDRTLVAVYGGDGAHQGSTSGPEPHVVQFLSP